jgi:hypothetical protein
LILWWGGLQPANRGVDAIGFKAPEVGAYSSLKLFVFRLKPRFLGLRSSSIQLHRQRFTCRSRQESSGALLN